MVSGGADSMALLSLACEFNRTLQTNILVHHCNHGVAKDAVLWANFVEKGAFGQHVQYQLHELDLEKGPCFEERARNARYGAVQNYVESGDVVMTAHHLDDQLETLLIRLSQGSGLVGLSGITETRTFGLGVLVRPLLAIPRKRLLSFLVDRNIEFVTDPSNADIKYLRNHIRLKLLPALLKVDPNISSSLMALSACAKDHVLKALKSLGERCPSRGVISIPMAKTEQLIGWQVRFFCQANGFFAPSGKQVIEFSRQCIEASGDRMPEVSIEASFFCIRRWDDRLYWIDNQLAKLEIPKEFKISEKLVAHDRRELVLPMGILVLQAGACSEEVSVFFGDCQQNFRLGPKRTSKNLKKIAQILRIPPWLRRTTPFLAVNDCLIGWGGRDLRDQRLINDSLQWQWEAFPRQGNQSSVS
jgi:tRNA(Ile)-lysidine synthase